MDANFWHEKWQRNETAFHEGQPNRFLLKHCAALNLPPQARVFVPLCGKTCDIPWLLSQGYTVAGVELHQAAVEQLFASLDATPTVQQHGNLQCFSTAGMDIWVGDLFALTAAQLGPVDAVYDRAALVALPAPMRRRYSHHLLTLCGAVPQLLIAYVYDQNVLPGPPFSVAPDEVATHYQSTHTPVHREHAAIEGGLKGKCPAAEDVWLLQPKA
jgi:thiopurine S-methyltransferase